MAYFSNGAEGEVFNNECAECVLGKEACPIFLVQSFYNYKACNNEVARAILNDLVKQDDDGRYIGCQMKSLIDSLLREESKEKTFRSAREVFKTYLPNKTKQHISRIKKADTSHPFRTCEFCGCTTNAKMRCCCDKGQKADLATVADTINQSISERITDILNKDFTVVCNAGDGITARDIFDVLSEARNRLEASEAENKRLKAENQTLRNARRREKNTLRKKQKNAQEITKRIKNLRAEIERLRNWMRKHFIETCPDAYCQKECSQCPEVDKWIEQALKRE